MQVSKLRAGVAAGAALVLVAAAGCSGDDDGGGSGDGPAGQAIYGEPTDFPQNLMEIIAAGNATSVSTILSQIDLDTYDAMPDFSLRWNEDLLAEEPTEEMVDGKQTITYKIHPDAVWSDGEPIVAEDFVFQWNLRKSNDPAEGGCPALLATTGYDQIETVEPGEDEKTAVVTYGTPYPDWRDLFGGIYMASHKFDTGDPAQNCEFITKGFPIAEGIPDNLSMGPYQLLKENIDVEQQVVTLTPNPNWWGEPPGLERLVISNITNDPAGTVKAMQNEDVNVVYPQPQLDLTKQLQDLEPDVTTTINFGLQFEHMDMNTRNPHLAIPEVRKAIALGIDRPTLVQDTVGQIDDRAQVLNNRFWVNNQPQYEDNSGGLYDEQNVSDAQALLEQAGYTQGPGGVYVSPSGEPLELELMTTEANPLREQTVDIITEQLAEVGITINKLLNPDIFAGREKPKSLEAGGFDLALFAWVSAPFITPNLSIYKCSTPEAPLQNYTIGCDPRVDAELDKLSTELDDTKWGEIANQADTYLWENMFTLPLYQKPTILSYTSSLQGPEDNATLEGPLWNADEWTTVQ